MTEPARCRGTIFGLEEIRVLSGTVGLSSAADVDRLRGLVSELTTADAMSVDFDLVPTDVCWKDVAGIECGEPSDPESETGMCAKHRAEVRKRWSKT